MLVFEDVLSLLSHSFVLVARYPLSIYADARSNLMMVFAFNRPSYRKRSQIQRRDKI